MGADRWPPASPELVLGEDGISAPIHKVNLFPLLSIA